MNDGTTHWEGCERVHHACALARLAAAEARATEAERELAAYKSWNRSYDALEARCARLREALAEARDWADECESYLRGDDSWQWMKYGKGWTKSRAIVDAALAAGEKDAGENAAATAGHGAGEMSAAGKGAGSGGRSAVEGDPPQAATPASITLTDPAVLAVVEAARKWRAAVASWSMPVPSDVHNALILAVDALDARQVKP